MAEAARESGRRFFARDEPDARPAEAVGYNHPRPVTAASNVIDLSRRRTQDLRKALDWQTAAWNYYDQVGELKYAFNLISQIVSRAMIYAALVEDTSEVPIDAGTILDKIEDTSEQHGAKTSAAIKAADEAIRDLTANSQSEMMRLFALNLSIPGECYLVREGTKWVVASTDEIIPGTPTQIRHQRSSVTGDGMTKSLPENTYIARIWRSHPRWSGEADSSMLGVLDQVEKIVLFDQVMRTLSRSRLSAGIIYIPTGITPAGEKPLHEAINEATINPVEDESVDATVTPLLLTGPPEIGKEIKRIDLAREVDENLMAMSENAIDRMLAGLDIPKNIVSGLADTRYSNALVIDDSLYKAHIEPLVLMICDALTSAYLRPALRKAGVDEDLVRKFVVWYNPSAIVTRPDRSSAANEGFDRYLLSGEAWRRARGYSDLDAPTEDEILMRLALDKATIPPDMATALIERLHPDFFAKQRKQAQEAAGVPDEVASMLSGETPDVGQSNAAEPAQAGNTESALSVQEQSGGEISQGGPMPPRPDNRERGGS